MLHIVSSRALNVCHSSDTPPVHCPLLKTVRRSLPAHPKGKKNYRLTTGLVFHYTTGPPKGKYSDSVDTFHMQKLLFSNLLGTQTPEATPKSVVQWYLLLTLLSLHPKLSVTKMCGGNN